MKIRYLALMAAACFALLGTAAAQTPVPAKPIFHPYPQAKGPFSRAVRVGNIVFLSGQIGIRPDGTLSADFAEQSRQVMDNIRDDLKAIGLGMDDVVKCTVMIDDMARWPDFNKIYVEYFSPTRLPARSAFGADGLALGAAVEVECIAHDPRGD